ncbi:hypothetical protein VP01_32g23 [Puccinia sorghi]|uniref:Uncharacterized protein n=1 Tax=Puccinia sorghi TaxID=27349 RepID=A0A0L6UYC1_9BASI|nr:hypothetical protein VP01_32g23 [Puccinia sorghi]
MTTLMRLEPNQVHGGGTSSSSADDDTEELEMLELNVRLFEQSLVKALMDPLDQQSLASLYLASMKLLPYLTVSNHPTTTPTRSPRGAAAAHRQSLIDRLFLLLLALHHPRLTSFFSFWLSYKSCSLGKSKQKLKPTTNKSTNRGLPRDWLLGILAESIRQK